MNDWRGTQNLVQDLSPVKSQQPQLFSMLPSVQHFADQAGCSVQVFRGRFDRDAVSDMHNTCVY